MRLILLFLCIAVPARAELAERSQWVMGTQLRIVIDGPADEELFRECFDIATRCERVLSRWDPQAELAQLNASAGATVEVSSELFAWLERCARDHGSTGGAFDPTVGTWIIDPGSEVEIGMDRVRLGPGLAVFLPEGMALDSGGDGKGVAVDRIVERLREAGVEALVSFGGSSSFGIGDGPDGKGWRLAVADVSGEIMGTASLIEAGISVSHSVQVDHLEDGTTVRRPHIYDPATGKLVNVERTAVAWSTSATVAEVLSTALIVSGDLTVLKEFPGAEAVLTPLPEQLPDWIQD